MAELNYRLPPPAKGFNYVDNLPLSGEIRIHYYDTTGEVYITIGSINEGDDYKEDAAVVFLNNDDQLDNLIAALTLAKKYRSQRTPR